MQSHNDRRLALQAQAAYHARTDAERFELMAQAIYINGLPPQAAQASAAASAAPSQVVPSPPVPSPPVPEEFPDFNYDDAEPPPPPPPVFDQDDWALPPALSQADAQAYHVANPKRMREVVDDLEAMLRAGHAQKVAAAKHALEGKDGREAV